MTDYMNQYKRNNKTRNNAGKGTPRPGEIWFVSNLDNIKDRPVLVIGDVNGSLTIRKCTSQTSSFRQRSLIEDYFEAGLEKATYVDPEVRRLPRSKFLWKMGELSEYDREKFGF